MRVLRTTLFAAPDVPMTGVVIEDDLVDTIESFLQALYRPDVFVAYDVFSMPDGANQLEAISRAAERVDPEREHHMAVLYFWCVAHLPLLSDHGVITAGGPSPLTADDISFVMRQILAHPICKDGQTFIVHDETGDALTFHAVDGG